MSRIEMYTTAFCPYCVMAKQFLQRKGLDFEEVRVDTDPGTAAVTALFAAATGAVPEHRNTWPTGSALAAPVNRVQHGVGNDRLVLYLLDADPVQVPVRFHPCTVRTGA